MAAVDDLITSRDQIAAQIVALTASYKPDYSIDGQSIQHGTELARLTQALKDVNALIVMLSPYMIVSAIR